MNSYFMFNDILYKQKGGVASATHGVSSALTNTNQFFTEDMLTIFLLYLNQLDISQNFMYILIHVIHLNKK